MTTPPEPGAPQPCDLLITHGYILTMDTQRTVYPDGAVAIVGNRIVAVGTTNKIETEWTSSRKIDAAGGVAETDETGGEIDIGRDLGGLQRDEPVGGADREAARQGPGSDHQAGRQVEIPARNLGDADDLIPIDLQPHRLGRAASGRDDDAARCRRAISRIRQPVGTRLQEWR